MTPSPLPVCVDLDGTLIRSDLLLETFLLLIKCNPLYLFMIPFWLLRGKAALKAKVAARVTLDPVALPYNETLISWLSAQKTAGHPLWLCTASNYRLAELVAGHLNMFDGVLASSDTENFSGPAKGRLLAERFGERAFDYCGNHRDDIAVWKRSHGAVVVGGGAALEASAKSVTELRAAFPCDGRGLRAMVKALRLHQWAKNLLVLVPLAAAHRLGDIASLQAALIAFLAFGLCASSVYLLNDMLDLEADRLHPHKKTRPFAAGSLSLVSGFMLIPLLLAGAVILSWQLPDRFLAILSGYYLLTLFYSFVLKRIVLMDTITLAGLYTLRIIAGAAAVAVPLSFWLLLFTVFMFLSLALVKRYAELDIMRRQGRLTAAGRGYHIEDLPILHSMGTATGYLCVLVLALYINTPAVEALYRHPEAIWLLCVLLLYWISRVWLLAHRGEMLEDPLMFALTDNTSIALGLLGGATIYLAM